MTPSSSLADGPGLAAAPWTEAEIAEVIERLLARRVSGASICPSEVARQLEPKDWRHLMQPVREVAAQLARAGRLQVTQGGRVLAPEPPWQGAIRLRRPPDRDRHR